MWHCQIVRASSITLLSSLLLLISPGCIDPGGLESSADESTGSWNADAGEEGGQAETGAEDVCALEEALPNRWSAQLAGFEAVIDEQTEPTGISSIEFESDCTLDAVEDLAVNQLRVSLTCPSSAGERSVEIDYAAGLPAGLTLGEIVILRVLGTVGSSSTPPDGDAVDPGFESASDLSPRGEHPFKLEHLSISDDRGLAFAGGLRGGINMGPFLTSSENDVHCQPVLEDYVRYVYGLYAAESDELFEIRQGQTRVVEAAQESWEVHVNQAYAICCHGPGEFGMDLRRR